MFSHALRVGLSPLGGKSSSRALTIYGERWKVSRVSRDATPVDVGANVAAEMRRRRVTVRSLAKELTARLGALDPGDEDPDRMTESALSRRLNGHVDFRTTELSIVAEILGVPVSRLLGEEVRAS